MLNGSINGGSIMARNSDRVMTLLPLLPYKLISPSPLFTDHGGDTDDGFDGSALAARRGGNSSLWLALSLSLSLKRIFLSPIITFFLSSPLIQLCVCVGCLCAVCVFGEDERGKAVRLG
ncbi:hypothetical protein AAHE18_01G122600 [Arachis hypogaea]